MLFESVRQTSFALMAILGIIVAQYFFSMQRYRGALLFAANSFALSQVINFHFLLWLLGIGSATGVVGIFLAHQEQRAVNRKSNLAVALGALILLLLFFKNPVFADLLRSSQLSDAVSPTFAVKAIGFSYVFFKSVHFLVDAAAGRIVAPRLLTFLNYILFFPTFLAGPMDRYQHFAAWEQRYGPVSRRSLFLPGAFRIGLGLVKKTIAVPLLLPYATDYTTVSGVSGFWLKLSLSLIAYSIYLYLDFSGYCDLAIGSAAIAGFKVPENFRHPYFASSLSEFWSRWHMTLTGMLRQYLFKPLAVALSTRFVRIRPAIVTCIGYLITFTLCGLWHGPSANFALWGLWHGLGLTLQRTVPRSLPFKWPFSQRWRSVLGGILTFVFVTAGWVFFVYPTDKLHAIAAAAAGLTPVAQEPVNAVSVFPRYLTGAGLYLGPDIGWIIRVTFEEGDSNVYFNFEYAHLPSLQFERVNAAPRAMSTGFFDIQAPRTDLKGNVGFAPGEYLVRMKPLLKDPTLEEWFGIYVVIPAAPTALQREP